MKQKYKIGLSKYDFKKYMVTHLLDFFKYAFSIMFYHVKYFNSLNLYISGQFALITTYNND